MDEVAEVVAFADRLAAAGRDGEARSLLRRLTCFAPDHGRAWLACAEKNAAQPALALRRAVLLAPEAIGGTTEIWRALAQAHSGVPYVQGGDDKAEKALHVWAALRPADADAYFAAGLRRHAAIDPAGAAKPFGYAARLVPDLTATQLNAGSARFDSGRWREAAGYFRRVLAIAPNHAYALFQLGRCRRRLSAPDDAWRLASWARRLTGPRADFDAELAHIGKERGDWTAALQLGRRLAADDPASYDAWFAIGAAAEHLERQDAALTAYDRAVRMNPAFGEAYTRRAVLLLRRRLGPPPPRRSAADPSKRLAMSQLGVNGRFGNQILQYGFARAYAAAHDLTLETPDWIGRDLFDADDPSLAGALPRLQEQETDFMAALNAPTGQADLAGHDLLGFFCGDTTPLARHKGVFRAACRIGARAAAYAAAIEDAARSHGRTLVALHLRRGDFGWGIFWIAPEQWYLQWLAALWPQLDRPALYIASDDPAMAARFARYRPLTAADLPPPPPGAEFFSDFHILRCADALAISNSSFSFTAAMLNEKAQLFMRPDRTIGGLKPFDPWGAPVLLT